jgi:hypothetical protein
MRTTILSIGLLPLLLLVSPSGVCVPSIAQPGGWNMEIKVSAPMTPTGDAESINTFKGAYCLSREAMEQDPYLTPGVDSSKLIQKEEKCAISDEKTTSDSASWKKSCTTADGEQTELIVHTTATDTEMNSDVEKTVIKKEHPVTIKMAIHSTYAGDCTADMKKL